MQHLTNLPLTYLSFPLLSFRLYCLFIIFRNVFSNPPGGLNPPFYLPLFILPLLLLHSSASYLTHLPLCISLYPASIPLHPTCLATPALFFPSRANKGREAVSEEALHRPSPLVFPLTPLGGRVSDVGALSEQARPPHTHPQRHGGESVC